MEADGFGGTSDFPSLGVLWILRLGLRVGIFVDLSLGDLDRELERLPAPSGDRDLSLEGDGEPAPLRELRVPSLTTDLFERSVEGLTLSWSGA